MLYVFAGIVLGLCIAALIGELCPGGSLFPGFDNYYDDPVEYDLPVPDGWDEEDVVQTLAGIASL